jgi:hypothetical protein
MAQTQIMKLYNDINLLNNSASTLDLTPFKRNLSINLVSIVNNYIKSYNIAITNGEKNMTYQIFLEKLYELCIKEHSSQLVTTPEFQALLDNKSRVLIQIEEEEQQRERDELLHTSEVHLDPAELIIKPTKRFIIDGHGGSNIYGGQQLHYFKLPLNAYLITSSALGELHIKDSHDIYTEFTNTPFFKHNNKSDEKNPFLINFEKKLSSTYSVTNINFVNHLPNSDVNNITLSGTYDGDGFTPGTFGYWVAGHKAETFVPFTRSIKLSDLIDRIITDNRDFNCIFLLTTCRKNDRDAWIYKTINMYWPTIIENIPDIEIYHYSTIDEIMEDLDIKISSVPGLLVYSISRSIKIMIDDNITLNKLNLMWILSTLPSDRVHDFGHTPRVTHTVASPRHGLSGNIYNISSSMHIFNKLYQFYTINNVDATINDFYNYFSNEENMLFRMKDEGLIFIPLIYIINKCVIDRTPLETLGTYKLNSVNGQAYTNIIQNCVRSRITPEFLESINMYHGQINGGQINKYKYRSKKYRYRSKKYKSRRYRKIYK